MGKVSRRATRNARRKQDISLRLNNTTYRLNAVNEQLHRSKSVRHVLDARNEPARIVVPELGIVTIVHESDMRFEEYDLPLMPKPSIAIAQLDDKTEIVFEGVFRIDDDFERRVHTHATLNEFDLVKRFRGALAFSTIALQHSEASLTP